MISAVCVSIVVIYFLVLPNKKNIIPIMMTVRRIPYHFPTSNTVPTALHAVKKLMTKIEQKIVR
ncbi:MAG TPA: hypothetical protein PKI04_09465 [Kaistella sp.]|nr:hypothetical protein [Kaistella sp.]